MPSGRALVEVNGSRFPFERPISVRAERSDISRPLPEDVLTVCNDKDIVVLSSSSNFVRL
jgi:hypothetical protein